MQYSWGHPQSFWKKWHPWVGIPCTTIYVSQWHSENTKISVKHRKEGYDQWHKDEKTCATLATCSMGKNPWLILFFSSYANWMQRFWIASCENVAWLNSNWRSYKTKTEKVAQTCSVLWYSIVIGWKKQLHCATNFNLFLPEKKMVSQGKQIALVTNMTSVLLYHV